MNNESLNENLQALYIDPEQLKIVVGIIRKNINELKSAKEKEDNAWEACKSSINENIMNEINTQKQTNMKSFERGIEKLELYANKLESISNIWEDTENEIMSSSKEVEGLFANINRKITSSLFNSTNN